MSQTTHVLRRLTALLLAVTIFAGACADAPDPGDLAAFCDLLAADVGLSTQATEAEYAQLGLVAPPEIKPTIDSLQTQARDFDELLNVDPPDLAAIFTAKFDPAAESDRAELDRFAESGCNLLIARPPSGRWANFVRENHADAGWRDAVSMDFVSDTSAVTASSATFTDRAYQLTESGLQPLPHARNHAGNQIRIEAHDFVVLHDARAAFLKPRVGARTRGQQAGFDPFAAAPDVLCV